MRSPNAHVPPLLSKQRRNAMARGDTIYAVTSGSNDTRRVEDMPWGAVYHMYQTYWNLSKPILLDKSPAFLAYGPQIARALQAHGRRAAFIVLSRYVCSGQSLCITIMQMVSNSVVFVLDRVDTCIPIRRFTILSAYTIGAGAPVQCRPNDGINLNQIYEIDPCSPHHVCQTLSCTTTTGQRPC